MKDAVASLSVGAIAYLLWYFVALEVFVARTLETNLLGISLGLNAALVTWIALSRRSETADTEELENLR